MTVLKPAANDIVLGSKMLLADVSDTVGSVAFDFRVGAVNEFTIPIVDVRRTLLRRGLLREGNTLTYDGKPYQIAAIERDYRGDDVWLQVTCRSRLARRLRSMTGPHTWKDTTATAVITSLVKKAGGVAVVEPGAKLKKAVQKRNQSVLDLIAAIASDTGVEWVELDGVLYVGTAWWAFQGKTKLPLWRTDVRGVDGTRWSDELEAVAFTSRSSLDDRESAAEASLTVTSETGVRVRPWHRIAVKGADDADNGIWLVSGVSWDDLGPGVSVSLVRPLKSSPKDGSTGRQGNGDGDFTGTAGSLDGEWIEGADKTWPLCTRTPRQYVAWAQSRVGTSYPVNRCLQWVSEAVSGAAGRGGDYARYVWEKAPASAVKDPGNTSPPIGAIVVWGPPTGGKAGHIGISIGGGKMISATSGTVRIDSIAGFGSYYGAMTPSFWT